MKKILRILSYLSVLLITAFDTPKEMIDHLTKHAMSVGEFEKEGMHKLFTSDDFTRLAKGYTALDDKMPLVENSAILDTTHKYERGIFKSYKKDGHVVELTMRDLKNVAPDNWAKDHRYSQVYDVAHYGVQITDETKDLVHAVIREELRAKPHEEVIIGLITAKSAKTLDLTNPEVLLKLAITKEQLIDKKPYELTQQLAHVARKHGYDAMIAPGSKAKKLNEVTIPPTVVVFK